MSPVQEKKSYKGKLGGARPGAGRKKGTKLPQTLEREAVLKKFNERIYKNADILFNAAKTSAIGMAFVYRIDEEEDSKGRVIARKHVKVTDPDEIQEALDQIENGGENEKYYYITAKEPDIRAIDSLMNRGFGRPKETIEHQGSIGGLVGLVKKLEDGDTEEK